MAGVLHFDNRLEVKNRHRNEEISYQMHVFANSRYLLTLKNTFELSCDDTSFIYLKIQAANLRAHILTDLNNENRNVNTKKFLTKCMLSPTPHIYNPSRKHPHYNVVTGRFSFQNLNCKSAAYIPSTPSCFENVSHVKAEVINK